MILPTDVTLPPVGSESKNMLLTVQVTLSDSLYILSVNKLVAAFSHDVHRRQVHVVADPGTQLHHSGRLTNN